MNFKYAILFGLVLMLPFAFAQSATSGAKDARLGAAMDAASCKIDFTVGVANWMSTNLPNASGMADSVATLQADKTALQGLATANDLSGFQSYVQGTFDPHLRDASQAIRQTLASNRPLSNDTKAQFQTDYASLKSTLAACEVGALQQYAQAKVAVFNADLARLQSNLATLNGKGVDTSAMATILASAKSQIVDPLQSAIGASTNASQVRDALNSYCLYNGCKSGTNFHLASQLDIARINAILAFVTPRAQAAGLGDKVTDAQNQVNSAKSLLDSVGTGQYSDDQGKQMANSLKGAATDIKDMLSSLRQQARQNRTGFRNGTGFGNGTGLGRFRGRFNNTAPANNSSG